MRDGDQPRSRGHRREQRVLVGLGHHDAGAARVELAEQAEVLLVARDDLVLRAEPEPGDGDLAAACRGVGERDELRRGAEHRGEPAADPLPQLEHLLDVRLAAPALGQVALEPCPERVDGRLRERAVRAGVEVRVALEDGELGAGLLVRHSDDRLHRRVIGEHAAVDDAPLQRPRRRAVAQLQPADEDLVDAAGERRREAVRRGRHEVRVARHDRALRRERERRGRTASPVAVDVEVHDRHALELDRVGDAAQLRLPRRPPRRGRARVHG